MQDNVKYTEKIVIPCYDTDCHWRLKPVSFMNYAQEVANRHATLIGFGYDDLIKSQTAWVLSRMHIIFKRIPLWRDKVTLSTWHKGLERLFYLRDFRMTAEDGRDLIVGTTSWVVLNLQNRRMVRDPHLLDEDTKNMENAIETPCDKVQMPKDASPTFVRDHQVSYSDVDMNGHTNNAMYVQWAMDAIDYALTSEKVLAELRISFNHETRPGQTVSLWHLVRENGNIHMIEGRTSEASAFCVEFTFADSSDDRTDLSI